jgi:hypothetical protein
MLPSKDMLKMFALPDSFYPVRTFQADDGGIAICLATWAINNRN